MAARRAAEKGPDLAECAKAREPVPSPSAGSSLSNMEMQRLMRSAGRTAASHRKIGPRNSPDEREAKAAEVSASSSFIPPDVHLTPPGAGFPHPLQLGARAYAVQNNIVLDPAIAPDSAEGKRIVSHELVHVEQAQRTGDNVIRPYIADDMVGTSISVDYAQSLNEAGLDEAIATGHEAMRTHAPDSIEYMVAEENLKVIVAEVERRGYKSPALGRESARLLFSKVTGELQDVLGLVRQVISGYPPFQDNDPQYLVEKLQWMTDTLGTAADMLADSYDADPELALALIEQVGVRLTAVIVGSHLVRAYLPFPAFTKALYDDDPTRFIPTTHHRWARERIEETFADLVHLDWEGVDAAANEVHGVLFNLSNDLEGFEEATKPMIELPPSLRAGLVVLSVILTRRSIKYGGGPKATPRIGPGAGPALVGGSGAGVAVMGSVSVSVIELEAIRHLVSIGALSLAATAAAATGFEASYRIDESLPDELKDVLGEGPETAAMRATGKRGAGMERPPRHHVMPKEGQWRKWFKDRGIDIDDFTVELSRAEHEALHGGGNWRLGRTWPGEWNKNITTTLLQREAAVGRMLTRPEILKIVTAEMRAYGIPIKFIRYR